MMSKKSAGSNWIALYVNGNNRRGSYNAIHCDSFGVDHIPKEIKKFEWNKNIVTNIHRIQAYKSITCGCFCIGYFDFILQIKSLLDYTKLFSPYDYEKNDKIILKDF